MSNSSSPHDYRFGAASSNFRALARVVWAAALAASSFCGSSALAQDVPEERLYNFDDMLIDGEFRDPQGMFERARAESEFGSVLSLGRGFLDKSADDAKEPSMRP